MNVESFKHLAKTYTAIPVYRQLLADTLTPVSLFLNIREGSNHPFLFESVEGGDQLARYSFLGCNPYELLRFDGIRTELQRKDGTATEFNSYFDALRTCTTKYTEPHLPGLPRLTGGAVGFSSYDTFRQVEYLPNTPYDDLGLPEAVWGFYDEIYAFDHVKHQVILIHTVRLEEATTDDSLLNEWYEQAQFALDQMEAKVNRRVNKAPDFFIDPDQLTSNMEESYFSSMVEKAKQHIYEGDIFQVVLSQRFETEMSGDTFMLYRALRMVNPSPYLFYLDFNSFTLVGSSPEVLVSVQDQRVRVLPIAGTRKRGATLKEDLQLEADLKQDPKEIAEHIMLVDLGRNDVSRVSKPGSVQLDRNQVIERYSHVMHIVSDVSGQLAEGKSAVDALMQCFPAGTVSGAPKIRAMQIIDDMEPTKRGIYAGAVGYFDYSGNMDTCIAIRTMVVTGNKVYIQAGAGIVADSIAENEFEETVNKAGALVNALSTALDIRDN